MEDVIAAISPEVGGSRPTAEETSGLQHSLPAGSADVADAWYDLAMPLVSIQCQFVCAYLMHTIVSSCLNMFERCLGWFCLALSMSKVRHIKLTGIVIVLEDLSGDVL